MFVMRCKHPIFNGTWSFSSGSQMDRPPTHTSAPRETKALMSAGLCVSHVSHGQDEQDAIPTSL